MDGEFRLTSKDDLLQDHLVYVIICVDDTTILVEEKERNEIKKLGLVTGIVKRDEGWNAAAQRVAGEVKKSLHLVILLRLSFITISLNMFEIFR